MRMFLGIFLLLSGCAGKEPELVPVTAEELLEHVRRDAGEVNIVNFWASWCIPCREEFPDFVQLEKAYAGRGVRVFFVSIDFPEDIPHAKAFLKEQGVTRPTFLKTGKDEPFIMRIDSTWSGAIPATVVYDKYGRKQAFVEGKLDYATMQKLVHTVLETNAGG